MQRAERICCKSQTSANEEERVIAPAAIARFRILSGRKGNRIGGMSRDGNALPLADQGGSRPGG